MQSAAPQWIYEADEESCKGLDQTTFLIKAKGREFTSVVTFQAVQVMPQDQDEYDAMYRKLCTDAAGKMDMVGVLLHKYGHVLE